MTRSHDYNSKAYLNSLIIYDFNLLIARFLLTGSNASLFYFSI